MEKRIVTFFMLMVCAIGAMAQQYSVQCQVNDSKGEGVPFATIYIYNIGDTTKVVSSGVSDAFGKVNHHLANPGSYLMRVHFVGMAPQERAFEVGASAPVAQLGIIVLSTQSTTLKEVTVTTQRQLVTTEIDRLTYDVQADADSRTSNVLDMLKKVPMVSVDGKDDILVKGSTSFKVYRNGHPDPALSGQNMKDVLKAIPASSIKKIEVITDPGAKYDAEGTEAILNIVTVGANGSLMQGVMGTVSLSVDNTGSPNGNTNIVTQIGKVVASVNYGYTNKNRHYDHNIMESEHTYASTGNSLYSHNETRGTFNFHYGNLSASWEPDTLNLVSLSFGGYYYDHRSDGLNNAHMTDRDGNPLPLRDNLDYVYIGGLIVQDVIRVDFQGKPIVTYVDRGQWYAAANYYCEAKNPTTGVWETSDVWYMGCKYRCCKNLTKTAPAWNNTDWAMVEGNPDFTVEFADTDYLFDPDRFAVTLTIIAKLHNIDVTADILDADVIWTRYSEDDKGVERVASDNAWALKRAGAGKSINLTAADVDFNGYVPRVLRYTATVTLRDGMGEPAATESVSFEF